MKQFLTVIVNLVDNLKATKQFIKFLEKYSTIPFEVFFVANNISNKHEKFIREICSSNSDIYYVDANLDNNYLSEILSDMQGTIILFTDNNYLLTKKATKSLNWYFKHIDDVGILVPSIVNCDIENIDEKIAEAKQNRKFYKHISENIKASDINLNCFFMNEKILGEREVLGIIDDKKISISDIVNIVDKLDYQKILAKDVIFISICKDINNVKDDEERVTNLDKNEKITSFNSKIQESDNELSKSKNFDKEDNNTDDIDEEIEQEFQSTIPTQEEIDRDLAKYKKLVLAESDVHANYEKAKNMLQNKNYEQALGYLIYATEKYLIDFSVKNIELKDLYSLAGQISLYLEEPKLSLYFFEEELKLEDNSSRACEGLADALILNNEVLKAKYMYQWAVKCDEQNINARNKLARLNSLLGLPEDDITEE